MEYKNNPEEISKVHTYKHFYWWPRESSLLRFAWFAEAKRIQPDNPFNKVFPPGIITVQIHSVQKWIF